MMKGDFKMTAVLYRGSAPAINDLLAGTIDMVPDYLLANKGNIDAGKLKFIAVASEQRLKDYPNVPTVSETLPGVTSITWMAVSAPPGTPKEITKKISDAIGKGFKAARHAGAHPQARSDAARQHAGRHARHDQAEPRHLGAGGARRRRSRSIEWLDATKRENGALALPSLLRIPRRCRE